MRLIVGIALSLLVPGLGHLSMGALKRMTVFLALDVLTIVMLATLIFVLAAAEFIPVVVYWQAVVALAAAADVWWLSRRPAPP